jgi:N-hydroxyarylamine O-acetyltransferase
VNLVERVFAKLGFAAAPKPDRAGLDALYAAWCWSVPFDNLRKRIALAGGSPDPLPGGLPDDFLAAFLEHGRAAPAGRRATVCTRWWRPPA